MKVLSILLAISVGLNLWFGIAYLGQRDTATVAKVEQRQTVGVALSCSEGTEKLAQQASQREAEAAPKRRQAREKAAEHERKADRILATPVAVPGNACASAQAELDTWWETRK